MTLSLVLGIELVMKTCSSGETVDDFSQLSIVMRYVDFVG